MSRWQTRLALAAIFLGSVAGAPAGRTPARAGETIRINGSGAPLDMMVPMNAAYQKEHPDIRIIMEKPLGSSGAIMALLGGALDLAVSSKTLTPEQLSQGAASREYGRTPLVIVTGKNVPITDITTRELEDIYAGKVRVWPNGERIRIVLRPRSDVDTAILQGLSPGMRRAVAIAQEHPGMVIAVTDPESNETVAGMAGAIGASGLCSLLVAKPAVRSLSLNGVKPGTEALATRSYPLAKEIRFVTKGAPSRAVTDYLEFIYSAQGRAIASRAGVLADAAAPKEKNP